jgi:phosphate transport system substrate-binding protein
MINSYLYLTTYEKDYSCSHRPAVILLEFRKMILVPAIVLLSLTVSPTVSADEPIKIGGVGSALGSMKILAEAFEKSHPGQKVRVLPSLGSSGGIKAVSKNAIDIAVSSRALNDEEKKSALSAVEYARTPFVFVSRKDTKVSNLTTDEIIKIYKSETQAWPGGARIRLILRPVGETDTMIAKRISPEMNKAVEAASARPGMVIALTDQENTDILEKTPGSLGFSTLTQIINEKHALKVLSYNGVTPSTKNLADGSYTLFKPFLIVTATKISPPARKFLEYLGSTEGIRILKTTGNLVVNK